VAGALAALAQEEARERGNVARAARERRLAALREEQVRGWWGPAAGCLQPGWGPDRAEHAAPGRLRR
jgi:hypothetical protein